jgi:hypothetical protein
MERRYARWLADYTAPSPEHQDYCHNVLSTGRNSSSMGASDLILFFNLFKYWPLQNRTGYYVDSGAAYPHEISNTFFFDACLGWPGLCIEPQAQFHADLAAHRSCALATECVSDVKRRVRMDGPGLSAESLPDYHGQVRCLPLDDLLSQAGWAGAVDVWSLDVEGHERAALRGAARGGVDVRAVLVEDFWVTEPRELDREMMERGYVKFLQARALLYCHVPRCALIQSFSFLRQVCHFVMATSYPTFSSIMLVSLPSAQGASVYFVHALLHRVAQQASWGASCIESALRHVLQLYIFPSLSGRFLASSWLGIARLRNFAAPATVVSPCSHSFPIPPPSARPPIHTSRLLASPSTPPWQHCAPPRPPTPRTAVGRLNGDGCGTYGRQPDGLQPDGRVPGSAFRCGERARGVGYGVAGAGQHYCDSQTVSRPPQPLLASPSSPPPSNGSLTTPPLAGPPQMPGDAIYVRGLALPPAAPWLPEGWEGM